MKRGHTGCVFQNGEGDSNQGLMRVCSLREDILKYK